MEATERRLGNAWQGQEEEEKGVTTLLEFIREDKRREVRSIQFLSVDSWIRCVIVVVYSYDS